MIAFKLISDDADGIYIGVSDKFSYEDLLNGTWENLGYGKNEWGISLYDNAKYHRGKHEKINKSKIENWI